MSTGAAAPGDAATPARGDVRIRVASPEDAAALVAIYAPYVRDTTITFEETVPSVEEFGKRIAATLKRYPYLVAQRVDGEILGYAYAGAYSQRVAYDWSVETAIYVSQSCGGQGVGSLLYAALERALQAQHVVNLGACITAENVESIGFHRHLGYETVANFAHFGFKFNRWLDVVWMEKTLGEVPVAPEAFVPFDRIDF